MRFYKVLAIIVFSIVTLTLIWMSRISSGKIISPQSFSQNQAGVTVTPISTPTPSPVTFNESSNLETEAENLTLEDFSKDYTSLKEEAGKL